MNCGLKHKQTNLLNRAVYDRPIPYVPPWSRTQNLDIDFRIVPEQKTMITNPPNGENPWRITLMPVGEKTQPIGLELHGDIVIGSKEDDDTGLDINLSHLKGFTNGVSRRHIMLRPRKDKIFVMDLHSTNGTRINGLPLSMGWAEELHDGDLLTLGALHLQVRFVRSPELVR